MACTSDDVDAVAPIATPADCGSILDVVTGIPELSTLVTVFQVRTNRRSYESDPDHDSI